MIKPRNETDGLIFSIIKNCETLNNQFHKKHREMLEFKLTQPRELFSYKPSKIIGLDSKWMIGLTSLEVYNSIFTITTKNIKFELYTDPVDEFSFTELKDKLEEGIESSNISPEHQQYKIIGPRNSNAYIKLSLEKRQTDGYIMIEHLILDLFLKVLNIILDLWWFWKKTISSYF